MATRALLMVQSGGDYASEGGAVLYHHLDGYPRNMIPLIARGVSVALRTVYGQWRRDRRAGVPGTEGTPFDGPGMGYTYRLWQGRRLASALCAADPLGYEPGGEAPPLGRLREFMEACGAEYAYVVRPVRKVFPAPNVPRFLLTVYALQGARFEQLYGGPVGEAVRCAEAIEDGTYVPSPRVAA